MKGLLFIFNLAFFILVNPHTLFAQNEIYCEPFEEWTVGTGFLQDEQDTSIYTFYDIYNPYSFISAQEWIQWNSIIDENFDSIALYGGFPAFELHSGVYPYIFSDPNMTYALGISLLGVFNKTGLFTEIPNYDFAKEGVLHFDYSYFSNDEIKDTLKIEIHSDQDSFVVELIKELNVSVFAPAAFIIPPLSHTLGYDSLRIKIIKEAIIPNSRLFVIDNLCLVQEETTSTKTMGIQPLHVYPTLVSGNEKIQVDLPNSFSGECYVLNSISQVLWRKLIRENTTSFDVSTAGLASGVYQIVFLDKQKGKWINRFMKL